MNEGKDRSENIEELVLPPPIKTQWRQVPTVLQSTQCPTKTRRSDERRKDSAKNRNDVSSKERSHIKVKVEVAKLYKKQQGDELSLTKGEQITITSTPDEDGFVRGYKRTKLGLKKKGYVPVHCISEYQRFWR